MKNQLISLLRWPWWPVAGAAALTVPWLCYAAAGYIEAAAQFQFAGAGQQWMQPSAAVLPISAIVAFVATLLVGLAVDRFRAR